VGGAKTLKLFHFFSVFLFQSTLANVHLSNA
jgi:hypothetical protein